MKNAGTPSLKELAARINSHLERYEADASSNVIDPKYKTQRFYHAYAGVSGRYVRVTYISYQGSTHITKDEAMRYLEKLDAGFVGRHFEALR
jgi:hypothetical protein